MLNKPMMAAPPTVKVFRFFSTAMASSLAAATEQPITPRTIPMIPHLGTPRAPRNRKKAIAPKREPLASSAP